MDHDPNSDDGAVDLQLFKVAMANPGVIADFFFPANAACWQAGRYVLRQEKEFRKKTWKAGVRVSVSNAKGDSRKQRSRHQETPNYDLSRLVASVRHLRTSTILPLRNLVLSDDFVVQPGREKQYRIRFGLERSDRYVNDEDAAWECHQRLLAAIKNVGYRAEPSTPSKPGFDGLQEWAGDVNLRAKPCRWRYVVILLVLLVALVVVARWLGPSGQFAGIPVETRSFIVLVDKSSSMSRRFDDVRDEAKQLLEVMKTSDWQPWISTYADYISYDDEAHSALGKISVLDDQSVTTLNSFLDKLQPGGRTRLQSAMEMAANEVGQHRKSVTILIVTDGEEDPSILEMTLDPAELRAMFQGVDVMVHTMTPRLFEERELRQPQNDLERNLAKLSEILNGRFAPKLAKSRK